MESEKLQMLLCHCAAGRATPSGCGCGSQWAGLASRHAVSIFYPFVYPGPLTIAEEHIVWNADATIMLDLTPSGHQNASPCLDTAPPHVGPTAADLKRRWEACRRAAGTQNLLKTSGCRCAYTCTQP